MLPQSPKRWTAVRITIVTLIVVVVAYAAYAVLVPVLGWATPRAERVTAIVPSPVGAIGFRPIAYRDFVAQYRALKHYQSYLQGLTPTATPQADADQRATALTKIYRDAATAALIDSYGIAVTDADIAQAFSSQVVQGGNQQNVTEAIRNLYGWTPEQFQNFILRAAVGREKLREKLSFDETLNTTSREQANRVYDLVKQGQQSFEELAQQYSDDVFGSRGGDMGYITRGEQAKEIEDAAFSLDVGSISEIIHTKFGFHILKIEDRKTVDGQEQAKLRGIFIAAPSVDEQITKHLRDAGVYIFIPRFRWDGEQGNVVPA